MRTERSEGAGVACFHMLMSVANLQMKDMLPTPCPPAKLKNHHSNLNRNLNYSGYTDTGFGSKNLSCLRIHLIPCLF